MNSIGTLGENSLHAALKTWFSRSGDLLETAVEGYVIDIVRGDLLVEIQTGNFSAIKRKLGKLLESHRVQLVYPISAEKWIRRLSADGQTVLGQVKIPQTRADE